jgi:hypothetical protein
VTAVAKNRPKPIARTKPERFLMRVVTGALEPADAYVKRRLRERNYCTGQLLLAELKKPRNPGFHRLAHALGAMCAENIDEFAGLDAHDVLKRLQAESGIGCDMVVISAAVVWQRIADAIAVVAGDGLRPALQTITRILGSIHVAVPLPRSLSFESMDQGEFSEVFRGLCRYIAKTYWLDMTDDQIADMAELFPEQT